MVDLFPLKNNSFFWHSRYSNWGHRPPSPPYSGSEAVAYLLCKSFQIVNQLVMAVFYSSSWQNVDLQSQNSLKLQCKLWCLMSVWKGNSNMMKRWTSWQQLERTPSMTSQYSLPLWLSQPSAALCMYLSLVTDLWSGAVWNQAPVNLGCACPWTLLKMGKHWIGYCFFKLLKISFQGISFKLFHV